MTNTTYFPRVVRDPISASSSFSEEPPSFSEEQVPPERQQPSSSSGSRKPPRKPWRTSNSVPRRPELEGAVVQEWGITFRDIMKATRNFNSSMEIGSGDSGKVYKAVLQGRSALAVKKIQSYSITALGKYVNEVETLESLKNEHLVQLLGWYTGGDHFLLIYEYMENNSLLTALFESKLEFFSWETRYRICLQIANGLLYLHQFAKIIHGDINPSNILLDGNLNAKISNFGSARFDYEERGIIMTKLCGIHGYMAPEYAMRGILSEKTDVYSYGVVVLEIISGRTHILNPEYEFLFDEVYVPLDLIDATVKKKPDYNAKQASKLFSLAMLCTNLSPPLRPTMSEVVNVLEGVKTIQELRASKHAHSSGSTSFVGMSSA